MKMNEDNKPAINDVTRSYGMGEKTQFDDDTLTVRGVVISSDAIDSYQTKFDVAGAQLDRFQTNPILLFNHDDYTGLPVGRVTEIRAEENKLLADIQLEGVTEGEKSGRNIYSLLKAGFLNGFSIRFEPLEWHDELAEGGGEITVFDKWRLLEVSVVNIPANPEAVVTRAAKTMTADEIRALVAQTFEDLQKNDAQKKQQAENQRQALTTDLSAAIVEAYKGLGKLLRESKK